ncbi:MAG: Hpt domain-containing protein [Rickettsiales bacterium]
MTDPVNLRNLRLITEGDQELERELFREFLSSFSVGAEEMEKHISDPASAGAWKGAAHRLKGMALNLGAETLGNYCMDAEARFGATIDEKAGMLASIQKEFERVRLYLEKTLKAACE